MSKAAPGRRPESAQGRTRSRALVAERALHASNTLLQALTAAQLEFIGGSDAHILFDKLLGVLLELTESEYGFIGEVLRDEQGAPSLRSFAMQGLELRNLN